MHIASRHGMLYFIHILIYFKNGEPMNKLLLLFLISFQALGQVFEPTNDLNFMRNTDEYQRVRGEIHEVLKAKILNEISIMSPQYKQMQQFLSTNQPEIITREVEFEETQKNGKKTINPKNIYFVWGYNRAFHSNSDMTFKTSEGEFTIHNAQGVDRPSPFGMNEYFNPVNLSIPQYVVKLGYMFDEKWGIELAQDHMKWVFVNDIPYEVSGDFSPTLYVTEDGEQWPVAQSFNDIKNSGNMTWLQAEHTDGYNYVNISAVYNLKVYATKNEIFRIDLRPNAGFGLMIPKTRIMMHKDQMWEWKGLDNRFHIAGFGAHVEAKVRLTFFHNFFIEAAARGTYIKIENALVNGTSDRLEHTPISSLQLYGAAGFNIPLDRKKKRKKPMDF
jgi:hypothetical protein